MMKTINAFKKTSLVFPFCILLLVLMLAGCGGDLVRKEKGTSSWDIGKDYAHHVGPDSYRITYSSRPDKLTDEQRSACLFEAAGKHGLENGYTYLKPLGSGQIVENNVCMSKLIVKYYGKNGQSIADDAESIESILSRNDCSYTPPTYD